MICCSVEQHDNGISHGCNWRFHIQPVMRSCRRWLGKAHWCLLAAGETDSPFELCTTGEGEFMHLHVSGRVCQCQGPACQAHVCPVMRLTRAGAPCDSPLLGPLDSRGWGRIFISSSENARAHVCSLCDEYVICLTPAGQEGETLQRWWIITRHSQDGESSPEWLGGGSVWLYFTLACW